jgi:hypothetical protein
VCDAQIWASVVNVSDDPGLGYLQENLGCSRLAESSVVSAGLAESSVVSARLAEREGLHTRTVRDGGISSRINNT